MATQEPLVGRSILSHFRAGSSLPVLVETISDTKCVVKWKCTGEGPIANAVDWICLKMAREIGIPVPTPHQIIINTSLIDPRRDPDINDLVTRSLGINLCLEYLENTSPYNHQLVHKIDVELKNLIYLFDVLLLNVDRTDANPNMVFSMNRLYCIDFAATMSIKMLINSQAISERTLLPLIRRHPFYSPQPAIGSMPFESAAAVVEEIVNAMPDEWLVEANANRQHVCAGIKDVLLDSRSILEHRLSLLNELPLESEESMKKRTLNNRRAFEAKWGKL